MKNSLKYLSKIPAFSYMNYIDNLETMALHYGTVPVDPRHLENHGFHDYLRTHKGSRRMSLPLIQDSSVSVLFPRYKGNLT